MLGRILLGTGLAAGISLSVAANNAVTEAKASFYKDVLPILQENCQDCHRPGGKNMGGMVAPMAFFTYEESRPWAKAMAKAVANRTMPPWHAAGQHAGQFENERGLTDAEVQTIVGWVNGGAAKGNPADAPAPREWPTFKDGWALANPDLVISMPEPFFVPDDLLDDTHYFPMELTEEQLPEDRWIKSVEFRPGSEVVHHIIATPVGGIAPGSAPTVYREGFSAKLHKGEKITWQMHYHKEPGPGTGVWDQSSVAITFYPKDYVPQHVLTTDPLGTFQIDIPPNDANYTAKAELKFAKETWIMNMLPHMHYRGSAARYTLYYPDGTEEILLDVPRYDYNWQTTYRFKEPKVVPAGTRIEFQGWWDNSANNPLNPDPSKRVTWGEATHEEMMFGWLSWTHPDEDATAHSGYTRRQRGTL